MPWLIQELLITGAQSHDQPVVPVASSEHTALAASTQLPVSAAGAEHPESVPASDGAQPDMAANSTATEGDTVTHSNSANESGVGV